MTANYTVKDAKVPKKLLTVIKLVFGEEMQTVFDNSLKMSASYSKLSDNVFVNRAEVYCLVDALSYLIFVLNFDSQGRLHGQCDVVYFVAFLGATKTIKSAKFQRVSVSDLLDKQRRHQLKQQQDKTKQTKRQQGYDIIEGAFGL